MSWHQVARSRRRDWERKRAPKAETVAIELDTSRWEAVVTSCINDLRADMLHYPHVHQTTVPQTGRLFGEMMRMALGDQAKLPEGPPYVHTYTMPPTEYPDFDSDLHGREDREFRDALEKLFVDDAAKLRTQTEVYLHHLSLWKRLCRWILSSRLVCERPRPRVLGGKQGGAL